MKNVPIQLKLSSIQFLDSKLKFRESSSESLASPANKKKPKVKFETNDRLLLVMSRSSDRKCSVSKGVLKNFANFTGKHMCWTLFLKKRLQHRCFPVKFAKLLRTLVLKNTSEQLLLAASWLKGGFSLRHISWLFRLLKLTTSWYIIAWINLLYEYGLYSGFNANIAVKISNVKWSHLGQILNFKKIDLGQL